MDLQNLDLASVDPSTNVTEDQFKSIVETRLQNILNMTFSTCKPKQHYKTTMNGYNFACPYCRDSATNMFKKRGNLSLRGKFAGIYKCFNCDKSTSIQTFFKDFNQELDMTSSLYVKNNVTPDFTNTSSNKEMIQVTAEILNKDSVIPYTIERDKIKTTLGLCEINPQESPIAYTYLVNRGQSDFSRMLYSYKYNQVVIMNMVDDMHVLGIQTRNLNKTTNVRYLTYTISKLRKALLNDTNPVPSYIENISTMFNLFNVDFNRPILVTEGAFDAFLLPNAIATSGAGKNLNVSVPFWYVYDSDKTGIEHAIEKVQEGYNVFMWSKVARELNLPERKKWDITDLFLYTRQNHIRYNIFDYFTNNSLDILSL